MSGFECSVYGCYAAWCDNYTLCPKHAIRWQSWRKVLGRSSFSEFCAAGGPTYEQALAQRENAGEAALGCKVDGCISEKSPLCDKHWVSWHHGALIIGTVTDTPDPFGPIGDQKPWDVPLVTRTKYIREQLAAKDRERRYRITCDGDHPLDLD